MQVSEITGLESWAQPILYLTGIATAAATGISAGRFKASAYSDLPAAKWTVAVILLISAAITVGIGCVAATVMAPTQNPMPTTWLMLALSTIPQLVVVILSGSPPNIQTLINQIESTKDAQPEEESKSEEGQ